MNPMNHADMHAFFEEAVQRAAQDAGASLSQDAARYLVTLLMEVSKTDRLYWARGPNALADLHIAALEAPPGERVRIYKLLGDHALTVAGFFQDSLNRRVVGVEYYAQMGESAYRTVADLFALGSSAQNVLTRLFEELGRRFRTCLGVLSEVGDRFRSHNPPELVRLYERWLTCRDSRTAEKLVRAGVLRPGLADA